MWKVVSGWGSTNPTTTPRALLPLSQSCELYQPHGLFQQTRPTLVGLTRKEQKALLVMFHREDQAMWEWYETYGTDDEFDCFVPIVEPYVHTRREPYWVAVAPSEKEQTVRFKLTSREVLEEPEEYINRIASNRRLLNRSDYKRRYQLLQNLIPDTAKALTQLGFTREDNWGWTKDPLP